MDIMHSLNEEDVEVNPLSDVQCRSKLSTQRWAALENEHKPSLGTRAIYRIAVETGRHFLFFTEGTDSFL
jgi:hypothetical protein